MGTWKNLTISNQYWAEASSGLVAADREKLDAYTLENTTGLRLGDLEWTEFANIQVSGCKTGVDVVKGKRIEFAGSFLDVTVTGCETAMRIQSMDERWGMTMARCRLEGSENALLNNSGRRGESRRPCHHRPNIRRHCDGRRRTGRLRAGLQPYPGEAAGKAVSCVGGYERARGCQRRPAGTAGRRRKGRGAASSICRRGSIALTTRWPCLRGWSCGGLPPSPPASKTGNSSGTLLLVYYGRDAANPDTDTAAVTLAGENAGIRGVRFLYPENGAAAGVRPYAYTVRGAAAGVYAVNTAISGGYNGVDFRGCDGHFIKKFVCCCYSNAMAGGRQKRPDRRLPAEWQYAVPGRRVLFGVASK